MKVQIWYVLVLSVCLFYVQCSFIDLLVNFEKGKKTYRNFYNLAIFAEEVLGAEVDLLTPQSVSPYILPYIEKDIDYVQITN